jgi:hypothetical protein
MFSNIEQQDLFIFLNKRPPSCQRSVISDVRAKYADLLSLSAICPRKIFAGLSVVFGIREWSLIWIWCRRASDADDR